jgi:predicted secreted protein
VRSVDGREVQFVSSSRHRERIDERRLGESMVKMWRCDVVEPGTAAVLQNWTRERRRRTTSDRTGIGLIRRSW